MVRKMSTLGYSAADWRTSLILGGLVVGQSTAGLLLVTVLPTIYRQNGLRLQDFWIFSLASAPIWLKWLWAPFVDRTREGFMGRRRSWILSCTLFAGLAYVALLFVSPTLDSLYIIVSIFFIQRLAMATQDIAVDGYTVDSLTDRNRPLASAVIAIADLVAYIGAVAGLLAAYEHFGWKWAMALGCAGMLLFTIPALFAEPRSSPNPHEPPSLMRLLRRPETPHVLVILLVSGLTSNFLWGMFGAFLVDRHFTLTNAGLAMSIAALPGVVCGSALGAWAMRRFGSRKAMPFALLMALTGTLPYIALSQLGRIGLFEVSVTIAVGVLLTMPAMTIFSAARLTWAAGEQSATDYTAQSSMQYAGKSVAAGAGGFIAAWLGWEGFFLVNALMIALFAATYLALASRVDRHLGASGEVPAEGTAVTA